MKLLILTVVPAGGSALASRSMTRGAPLAGTTGDSLPSRRSALTVMLSRAVLDWLSELDTVSVTGGTGPM